MIVPSGILPANDACNNHISRRVVLSTRVPECQQIKNGGLEQYGAEYFGRLIFAAVRKCGNTSVNEVIVDWLTGDAGTAHCSSSTSSTSRQSKQGTTTTSPTRRTGMSVIC